MLKWILNVFIGFLLLLSVSGCLQSSCCYYPTYEYICTKGSMNVDLHITGPPSSIQNMLSDSLNAYQANGYTCNTAGPRNSVNCVKGRLNINRDISHGDICSPTDDDGYCDNLAGNYIDCVQ